MSLVSRPLYDSCLISHYVNIFCAERVTTVLVSSQEVGTYPSLDVTAASPRP